MSRGENVSSAPRNAAPCSIQHLRAGNWSADRHPGPTLDPRCLLLLLLSHAFLSHLRSPAVQSQSRRVKPKPWSRHGSGSYESGAYSLRESLTHAGECGQYVPIRSMSRLSLLRDVTLTVPFQAARWDFCLRSVAIRLVAERIAHRLRSLPNHTSASIATPRSHQ